MSEDGSEHVVEEGIAGPIFSMPELVAQLSKVITLLPGDQIFTGTPAGVGTAHTDAVPPTGSDPALSHRGYRCNAKPHGLIQELPNHERPIFIIAADRPGGTSCRRKRRTYLSVDARLNPHRAVPYPRCA